MKEEMKKQKLQGPGFWFTIQEYAGLCTEELQNKCCRQYKGGNIAIRNGINCTGMNNASPQTSF